MFDISKKEYDTLIYFLKGKRINNFKDVAHDLILKYDNFEDCLTNWINVAREENKNISLYDSGQFVDNMQCKFCYELKPLSCFRSCISNNNVVHYRGKCRDCERNLARIRQRVIIYENPNWNKKQYRRNRQKRLDYARKYRKENREEINRKQRENRSYYREYQREYYSKNKDKINKRRRYLAAIKREKQNTS